MLPGGSFNFSLTRKAKLYVCARILMFCGHRDICQTNGMNNIYRNRVGFVEFIIDTV